MLLPPLLKTTPWRLVVSMAETGSGLVELRVTREEAIDIVDGLRAWAMNDLLGSDRREIERLAERLAEALGVSSVDG